MSFKNSRKEKISNKEKKKKEGFVGNIKEGLTNGKGKGKGKGGSKGKNAASSPWAAFTSASVYVIIIMWVLFPFYSWQLQIIFDQAKCAELNPVDCPLPYKQKARPYCPNGNCKESVSGPDSLNAIISFFTQTLQQIYEIITGMAWIKVDEAITHMEKSIAEKTGETSIAGKTGGGADPNQIGGGVNQSTRKGMIWSNTLEDPYGAAVDIAEQALHNSLGSDHKSEKNARCCDYFKEFADLEQIEKCTPGFSIFDVQPFKSIFPKDFGWPYTYLFNGPKTDADGNVEKNGNDPVMTDTRYDPNGSPDESSPKRWVGAWFAKTQQRSWSASRNIWSMILMFFYPFLSEELDNIEVELRLKKFIMELEKLQATTKSNEEKTSLEKEMPIVGEKGRSFGRSLGTATASYGKERRESKQKCSEDCQTKLKDIIEKFKGIAKKFKDKFKFDEKTGKFRGGKDKVRKKLFKIMRDHITDAEKEVKKSKQNHPGLICGRGKNLEQRKGCKLGTESSNKNGGAGTVVGRRLVSGVVGAASAAVKVPGSIARGVYSAANATGEGIVKADKWAKGELMNKKIDNIYLDFYVAAIKPPEHGRTKSGKEETSSIARFFNPFGGDTRYWMRYLITWYLPILTMILLMVSVFTGFWFTAISSINRYSNFILPFLGGIWVALANMFAQPTSLFFYMLFGGSSANKKSKKCPYDSGVYQMRKNMKQYFGLNLYITIAIIVTQLGAALISAGNKTIGMILSIIFPAYTLLVLIIKLFHYLWNLS